MAVFASLALWVLTKLLRMPTVCHHVPSVPKAPIPIQQPEQLPVMHVNKVLMPLRRVPEHVQIALLTPMLPQQVLHLVHHAQWVKHQIQVLHLVRPQLVIQAVSS